MEQAIYKNTILAEMKYGLKKGLKTVKIYTVNKVGKFKHSQYSVDHASQYAAYLDTLKVKYSFGNDAPKGGKLGYYIEIKLDRRNSFIKKLRGVNNKRSVSD